jgi:hypothetical protein
MPYTIGPFTPSSRDPLRELSFTRSIWEAAHLGKIGCFTGQLLEFTVNVQKHFGCSFPLLYYKTIPLDTDGKPFAKGEVYRELTALGGLPDGHLFEEASESLNDGWDRPESAFFGISAFACQNLYIFLGDEERPVWGADEKRFHSDPERVEILQRISEKIRE